MIINIYHLNDMEYNSFVNAVFKFWLNYIIIYRYYCCYFVIHIELKNVTGLLYITTFIIIKYKYQIVLIRINTFKNNTADVASFYSVNSSYSIEYKKQYMENCYE